MKNYFWFGVMVFCAAALACSACSDPSQDRKTFDFFTFDTDSDTGPDTDTTPNYDWEEEQVLSIKDAEHYQWAVNDQVNVIAAFVDGNYEENELYKGIAEQMIYHSPWLWLATVELNETPDVFTAAGVETTPTFKFFSYGVEMKELELTDEATDNDVHLNTSALMNRYEPDVLKPANAEELETMLADPDIPILVKFGATWCAPCQYMGPRMELASVEYGDDLLDENGDYIYDKKHLTVIDVNVDGIPSTYITYGFGSIPFFIFYNDGARYSDMLGKRPYHQLKAEIELFLDTCY